jgi:diguanylate cyclase (GGDEF)-like protein
VTGRPAWTEDLSAHSRHPEPEILRQARLHGAIALPLRAGTDVLGVITFASEAPRRYDADAVLMLERLGDQLAIFMDRVHRAEQVDALTDLAMTDALTGLPNRRAWDARLREHAVSAEREQQPLALALVDLDHFKSYNDTHGHQAGDALLASAARRWRRLLRPQDLLARYGGEEFAIVLPGCELEEAEQIVERLRRNVPLAQTCSIGLAASTGEPHDELVARADAALYAAKAAGRDCVRAAAAPAEDPALV